MKSFKEFKTLLLMGGNIKFEDEEAEQIDLKKYSRDEIVPKLKKSLASISLKFKQEFNQELLSKEAFDSNQFLSGSAFHFFSLESIPTKTFIKYKDSLGDIDTQVDYSLSDNLEKFLDSSLGDKEKFYQLVLKGFKRTSNQFITLWTFSLNSNKSINIQIDMEMVEFTKDEVPSEWAIFSHSSSWADMKLGIKGVFHKLLLRALTNKDDNKFIVRMKTKDKEVKSNLWSFSVAKGLREKYIYFKEGNYYKEIKPEDSTYITDLYKIFSILFSSKPSKADLKDFNSFSGLLSLMKRKLNPEQINKTIQNFADLLLGKKEQFMYKDNKEKDKVDKMKAFSLLLSTFNKPISPFDEIIKLFYQRKNNRT